MEITENVGWYLNVAAVCSLLPSPMPPVGRAIFTQEDAYVLE